MRIIQTRFESTYVVPVEHREAVKNSGIPVPLKFEEGGTIDRWWNHQMIDLDAFPTFCLPALRDIQFVTTSKPLEELQTRQRTVINHRINVAVPGFGLMMIKTVQVCLDCCTERLQEYLNDGWQILAICPQPDQRRPDYVIGKPFTNEDLRFRTITD